MPGRDQLAISADLSVGDSGDGRRLGAGWGMYRQYCRTASRWTAVGFGFRPQKIFVMASIPVFSATLLMATLGRVRSQLKYYTGELRRAMDGERGNWWRRRESSSIRAFVSVTYRFYKTEKT